MAAILPEHRSSSSVNDIASSSSWCIPQERNISKSPSASVNLAKKQNALVERRSMLFKLQSGRIHSESGRSRHRLGRTRDRKFFRCDVHATSAEDDRSAQLECKQLVVEAGGMILDNFQYLGGFLFELPTSIECPIESGDLTSRGGSIAVEAWQPFCLGGLHEEAVSHPPQHEGGRMPNMASSRIDQFFKSKKPVAASTDRPSCYNVSRDSLDGGLTLLDMLREGQIKSPNQVGANGIDDSGDWETLFDGSDGEDEQEEWPTSCNRGPRNGSASWEEIAKTS